MSEFPSLAVHTVACEYYLLQKHPNKCYQVLIGNQNVYWSSTMALMCVLLSMYVVLYK